MKPLVNQKSLLVLFLSVFFQLQAFSQSISGATTVCPNTTVRYTFVGSGCTSVIWGNVQGPAPVTIVAQTSTYIEVQFPRVTTSAPYRINAGYVCGGSSGNATLDVTVRNIPQSRTETREIPCSYRQGQMFDMDLTISATEHYPNATWTSNTGWAVTAGPRTVARDQGPVDLYYSEIDFLVNNSNAGFIKGTAVGYCPSTPYEVTYNITRPVTSMPAPSFLVAPPSQCLNEVTTFSVRPYPNAISYIWNSDQPTTKINGQTPPVTVSAANQSVTVSEATSHYRANISVKAVTGCGESPAAVTAVLVGSLETPTQMYLDGNPVGSLALDRFGSHTLSIEPIYGATSYTWVVSDNIILTGGQGTNVIDIGTGGRLGGVSVSVQPVNSCAVGGGLAVGGAIVGSSGGVGLSNTFDIYPNPAVSDITIRSKQSADLKTNGQRHDIRRIRVYDNSGKVVKEQSFAKGSGQVNVNVSQLAPGIYHVEITSDIIERKKIVIQR